MGNYRDATLEQLANKGNGQSVYIDSVAAAKKVFGQEVSGTLEVIAKDVKIQVAFDPSVVREYRLLGYENRDVKDSDFRKDDVDGGEIGAGHSVTALYEIQRAPGATGAIGTVFVRGKQPDESEAFEVKHDIAAEAFSPSLADASTELKFAAAVAVSADILRGNPAASDWNLAKAIALAAQNTRGLADRKEFVSLMEAAQRARVAPVAANNTY
jgi:Ca-activated chloride channel family protein